MKYITIVLLLTCSWLAAQAQDQPPKPAKAVDTLRMPKPTVDRGVQVTLPDNARLAFGIEQNGRAVNQLEAQGRITATRDKLLEIQAQDRQTVRLHYRLPGNMRLRVDQGQQVALRQNIRYDGMTELFSLQLDSEESGTLMGSGREMGDKPISVEPVKGIRIQQEGRPSNAERSVRVPVQLVLDGDESQEVPLREAVSFGHNNRKYTLWVELSSWRPQNQGMEDTRGGYLLEYVLTVN